LLRLTCTPALDDREPITRRFRHPHRHREGVALVASQSRVAAWRDFAMALPVVALARVFLFVTPPPIEVPLFPARELVVAFD